VRVRPPVESGLTGQLARLGSALPIADYALLHIGFQHAESGFVPLNGHVERLQHALGGEIVGDNPLLHLHRLGRDTKWLRIEAEIENEFLGRARNAAEIGVQADRVLVVHFHVGSLLILRNRLGLIAFRRCFLFRHDYSPNKFEVLIRAALCIRSTINVRFFGPGNYPAASLYAGC